MIDDFVELLLGATLNLASGHWVMSFDTQLTCPTLFSLASGLMLFYRKNIILGTIMRIAFMFLIFFFATQAIGEVCVKEGENITLKGQISTEPFSNTSGNGETRPNNLPEKFWMLDIDKPFCFAAQLYGGQRGIQKIYFSRVQLEVSQPQYNALEKRVSGDNGRQVFGSVTVLSPSEYHAKAVFKVRIIKRLTDSTVVNAPTESSNSEQNNYVPTNGDLNEWVAKNDFDAIYPAYVYANSTRKPKQTPPANYMGDPYGLLGIRIKTKEPNTKVKLSIEVDQIADTAFEEFSLPNAGEYQLYPRIRYRYERLKTITQPMVVNVTWTVRVNGGQQEKKTETTQVRSINEAPYAFKDSNKQISEIFAAYVNEDHVWIDQILRNASRNYRNTSFVGYQRGDDYVNTQVAAIYYELQRIGIRYSSITTTSNSSAKMRTQHVRFLSESIRNQQANCIDGTVLMASILRKIGIDPVIILGPGHAMLGYIVNRRTNTVQVIETTMIGSSNFDDAARVGDKKFFNEWQHMIGQNPSFQYIDIAAARRAGITPIPK